MKIILFCLLLGIITSASLPIVDVWFNYDYSLQKDYSSSYKEYFFRATVLPGEKMDIELRMTSSEFYDNYFSVMVLDYNTYPSDASIYNKEGYRTIPQAHSYDQGNYKVLYFTYTSINSYLGIVVSYSQAWIKFSYLLFRVDITKYKYSNIKELDYNTYYTYDTSIFNPPVIPKGYQIYIRIAVHQDDKMEIQLETKATYDAKNAFKVDVCQYSSKPVEKQVYYGTGALKCVTGLSNESTESMRYIYPFTTELDASWLSISIINQIQDRDLTWLNMYIYSEKGMAIALLCVIIIVPILIVGAIVAFVLKKLGIIR